MFPPSLILIIGGLLLPLIKPSYRPHAIILLPLLTLGYIWNLPATSMSIEFLDFLLWPMALHDYTLIFATVFALAAFAGGLFALNNKNITEIAAGYVYAGSAIGATFAGDYITLFIYWEVMAIGSTIVVLCGGTAAARKAAIRYAYMHFLGGVILLAGITAYIVANKEIAITAINFNYEIFFNEATVTLSDYAALLILIGVLINAAAPPFSAWLADAYPESSPSGAVFLSAFTTKTAVFVLLTIFSGSKILIPIGLFMIFYGIIYAMLENNIRRILSYSIVNQVGFMVVGVGIGTELAEFGVATHAFCHIIYKALLLMSAGAVIYQTGKHKCSEVGGLYRTMRITTICGIIGALAISAFPFTSGFVSKSMVTSASAYEGLAFVWFMLAAASAGVFLHAGIKFPWFVFFQKDSGLRPKDPPRNMNYAMIFLAAMCILPGIFPDFLYKLLPSEVEYEPYTAAHLVSQFQLLLFAGLVFFLFVQFTNVLKRTETISLDMDWFYRVFLKNLLLICESAIATLGKLFVKNFTCFYNISLKKIYKLHGPGSILARSWPISNTVLYATILLGMFLMVYFISN